MADDRTSAPYYVVTPKVITDNLKLSLRILILHLSTMPPQIKQDLNRSGWETTDFPSVCETCLPENPYVKMLKEDYGAECKLVCRVDSLRIFVLT